MSILFGLFIIKGEKMSIYFGTDGLRGIYGEEITSSIAFKCGNSLARQCGDKRLVLIGRDSRKSGDLLTHAFTSGLLSAGINVIDIGIASTPVIAFITKKLGLDFGVVISASHNPSNYNGIKIFDRYGYKISEEVEERIERKFVLPSYKNYLELGNYYFKPKLIRMYKKKLLTQYKSLEGLKIVLDCANGASYKIAKDLFTKLKANVIIINDKPDGLNINDNCGALYPNKIQEAVIEHNADAGFAFDGDADRIICCNEKGEILDGDDILYLLASRDKKIKGIVGTSMTNKGLENALQKKNIELLRADVGDKYVVELMKNKNISLGGEPSGHIILHNISTTGDGVLTALAIAKIMQTEKVTLSSLIDYQKFPQVNINIPVIDKYRILNSDLLSSEILKIQQMFGNNGRVLVRASGTEPKIRIMCEHINSNTAESQAKKLKKLVLELNKSQKSN